MLFYESLHCKYVSRRRARTYCGGGGGVLSNRSRRAADHVHVCATPDELLGRHVPRAPPRRAQLGLSAADAAADVDATVAAPDAPDAPDGAVDGVTPPAPPDDGHSDAGHLRRFSLDGCRAAVDRRASARISSMRLFVVPFAFKPISDDFDFSAAPQRTNTDCQTDSRQSNSKLLVSKPVHNKYSTASKTLTHKEQRTTK